MDLSNSDGNIVLTQTGTDVAFKLADDLKLTNVEVSGNTTVNNLTATGDTILKNVNAGNGTLVVNEGSLTVKNGTTVNMGGNKITNVAAGTDPTDAVNMSQLTQTENTLTAKGMNFGADGGTDVHRDLGQKLLVKGDSNITTTADGADTLTVALNKNLTADSLTINNGGPVINGGGINMGGKQITNLADGTQNDHAVNLGQLKDVEATANAGWNLGTNGDPAAKVAPGGKVDLSNSDGNIVLTQTGTDVAFKLADDLKLTNVEVSGNTTVNNLTATGDTILKNVNAGNGTLVVNEGSLTVKNGTTVNMGGNKITNVAAGTDPTDAVNMSQLTQTENTLTAKGMNFGADGGTDVHRDLGQKLLVKGDSNITTTADGTDTLTVALNKNLTADSLTINNGGPVINGGGINMGGKQITNLADGTQNDHAVNLGQLRDVEATANAGWNLGTNGDPAARSPPAARWTCPARTATSC
ncbi:hypothetical protein [Alcaligenes sp. Marseille-Q7550]